MDTSGAAENRAGEAADATASAVSVTQEQAAAPSPAPEEQVPASAEEIHQSCVQDAVLVMGKLAPLVEALMTEPFAFDSMPLGLSIDVWKLYKTWLSSRFTSAELESYGHSFQSTPDTIAMSQLTAKVGTGQTERLLWCAYLAVRGATLSGIAGVVNPRLTHLCEGDDSRLPWLLPGKMGPLRLEAFPA